MSVMVVAELSGNHGGDFGKALALIKAAKDAGADAVKLQTYRAEDLALDSDAEQFRCPDGPWKGQSLYSLYKQCETPYEWHHGLFMEARRLGLKVFSSPFTVEAVDFLETLDCPIYKVASFEITDLPLIRRIAATEKPVIMSTGGSTDAEIGAAIEVTNNEDLTLLHCISEYPAKAEDMNMGRLHEFRGEWGCDLGLSDHSLSSVPSVMAVALGATVIEKHLCLTRSEGGPDSSFSVIPSEFAETVRAVRTAERAMLAHPEKKPAGAHYRKALWLVKDIGYGDNITADHIRAVRPCPPGGIAPDEIGRVVGKWVRAARKAGTLLTEELIS